MGANASSSSANEGGDDHSDNHQIMDDDESPTTEEILRTRFAIITGRERNAKLTKEKFDAERYKTEPFCKYIARKQFTDCNSDSFCRIITKWETEPMDYQLTCLFSLISDKEYITDEILWRVLYRIIPEHSQEECKGIANGIISIMSNNGGKISKDQFIAWIRSNMNDVELQHALKFKISLRNN
jgi:hypothetical protein